MPVGRGGGGLGLSPHTINAINPSTPTQGHFVLSPVSLASRDQDDGPVELNDRHLRSHGKIGDCEQSTFNFVKASGVVSAPAAFYAASLHVVSSVSWLVETFLNRETGWVFRYRARTWMYMSPRLRICYKHLFFIIFFNCISHNYLLFTQVSLQYLTNSLNIINRTYSITQLIHTHSDTHTNKFT